MFQLTNTSNQMLVGIGNCNFYFKFTGSTATKKFHDFESGIYNIWQVTLTFK